MEFTTTQACKFILMTYDDGKSNKFYDSTFRIRPPFRPNSNGQYKITINECLFNNNEETLIKNNDYIQFSIKIDDEIIIEKFVINKDIFTNNNRDDIKIINSLQYIPTNINNFLNKTINNNIISQIKIFDENDNEYGDYNSTLKSEVKMKISINSSINILNIESISMIYSTNYGYLLNNLRATELTGIKNNDNFEFDFYNLRLGGPYLYLLKTPLLSIVPTYNENNQGYNVMACVYNTLGYHNQIIQMCSSMEVVANDLSNLRIELVNDQFEKINLKSPIYIQITISNE